MATRVYRNLSDSYMFNLEDRHRETLWGKLAAEIRKMRKAQNALRYMYDEDHRSYDDASFQAEADALKEQAAGLLKAETLLLDHRNKRSNVQAAEALLRKRVLVKLSQD